MGVAARQATKDGRRDNAQTSDVSNMTDTGYVAIIGAGLAGLSAAISLARGGQHCWLVSAQESERAQSVMAEGGINGCLDTMGDADTVADHFEDTMRGGVWLADPAMVDGLTRAAPDILLWLHRLGMPFNLTAEGRIQQRYFGGQKKRRTAYAMSSTGKMLITTLVGECRRLEAAGFVKRLCHHDFVCFLIVEQHCLGVRLRDSYTNEIVDLVGPVIVACGGMNGMFPGKTTGTTTNTGDIAATAFSQGVRFANLEMIQYHPTTIGIPGKRCLVSEAARGEGGRLWVKRNDKPWYFMEERYPELGNLMPRDVVSREEWHVVREPGCENQVYLDLTELSQKVWSDRLADLREEVEHYLGIDPAKKPVPVDPGIHYFMGGIFVDREHRTNLEGLYAAGECCCAYHGANRLGGNSTLGAIYGGRVAAGTVMQDESKSLGRGAATDEAVAAGCSGTAAKSHLEELLRSRMIWEEGYASSAAARTFDSALGEILYCGLGIVRDGKAMCEALEQVCQLRQSAPTVREKARCDLGQAMLMSGLARKESRGAHWRSDYPVRDDAYRMTTTALLNENKIQVDFLLLPKEKEHA